MEVHSSLCRPYASLSAVIFLSTVIASASEAIQSFSAEADWIASSLWLLAMTIGVAF
jgi:hypothetical protein